MVALVQDQRNALRGFILRLLPPRLIMAVGMDGARPGFIGEPDQFGAGASAPQDQRSPQCCKVFAKRCETVVQPPALRCAEPLIARCLVVENVDRDDRPAFQRCGKGGMIVKAQILPEPNQLRRHLHLQENTGPALNGREESRTRISATQHNQPVWGC